MAKSKIQLEENKVEAVELEAPKADPVPSEEKLKFLVWFSGALGRFKQMKPHHMTAVRVYFSEIGLGDPEVPSAYDEGLIKFGFSRGN